MTAAGYIRRSSADAQNPGAMSRETQEDAIASLARLDGVGDVRTYVDWGISGGKDDRPEYVRLKADIEAGIVTRVYAYDLSRLGRSTKELLGFVDLLEERGATLRLAKDSVDTSTASGRMLLTVLSAVAQFTREVTAEKQRDAIARKRARGDAFGPAPYGMRAVERNGRVIHEPDPERPTSVVLDALDEAGTVAGAVRLLNERGIPSPRGGKWHLSTARRVIDAAAPGLLATTQRKRTGAAPSRLAKLLRCHCGTILTPNGSRGQYYCNRARTVSGHGKGTIAEAVILSRLQDEAARLSIPDDVLASERDMDAERAGIDRRRKALSLQHEAGLIGDEEMVERMGVIRADLADLNARAALLRESIPSEVDWDAPPEAVNAVLRALWSEVVLDKDLHPIRVEWRDDGLRRAA